MTQMHAELLREMRLALLSEFGACAIYADLARWSRDEELKAVLLQLCAEEEAQVAGLSDVMRALGARPARSSLRRRTLAFLLASMRPLIGRRIILRICALAADKAARLYAEFQIFLRAAGQAECASTCGRLSETKHRHAQILEAWVLNS